MFMTDWNGVRIIPHPRSPSVVLWSDASGSFGCGAICLSLLKWIQLCWNGHREPSKEEVDSITWMELLAIVLACAVWGHFWQGQTVVVNCDNTGAVAVPNCTARHHGSCIYFGAFSLSEHYTSSLYM